ncbi:MAG: ROK family protein [Epulopiscium sp.]|nr:ROK family protein [Candidatus Epulonipiscium sp.]
MNKQAVGVDIGGTKMYMLAEYEGEYIERTVPTGIDCSRDYIKGQLDDFIVGLPFEVEMVGMALPGLVEGDNRLNISDVLPRLNGVESSYFGQGRFPVKFINDVKAATLTEANNHKEANTVATIMVGTGIAAGLAVEGKLFRGSQGFAGEMGWAYIPHGSGLERLDNLASGAAILEKAGCAASELNELLKTGDKMAKSIIDEAGYYFGVGLGLIIQFYNPDVIVVGGTTSTYPGYMEIAKETAKSCSLPQLFDNCLITKPQDIKRMVAKWAFVSDDN